MSAFAVLAEPSLKATAASWGLLVVLADLFWLTPWQKRLRDLAARIQEAFDCDVLELPWNEVKAGVRPDPELVKEQSDRYGRGAAARMPSLRDWYAPIVSDLPIHLGRIACQRTNCWWDGKQRRRYASGVISFVVVVVIATFFVSLGTVSSVPDFILILIAPLAPLLLLGIRHYHEQTEAATRADRLKEHSERLWTDALLGEAKTKAATRSRSLEDEILEHRRKSPTVFDWIFRRLRPAYESQMIFGIESLVLEAKQKGW
jgi:hypothetical protein